MSVDIRQQGQEGDALSEGRRVYMGNLLYTVAPTDVEEMLRETGFAEQFEKLHISVDPVSGRNPGYCFLEFVTREEAERALAALPGTPLCGRPIKVGPCNPKSSRQSRWDGSRGSDYSPTFQRWGDWKGADAPVASGEQGPNGAIQHLKQRARGANGAQLYIGGLGKMIDQEHHDTEIQELLDGFEIVTIGKRITPHPDTQSVPGNHHYCFVDLISPEEAERAMTALNGAAVPGGRLRVSLARSKKMPAGDPRINSWHPDHVANANAEAGPAGPAAAVPKQQDEQERREERREQAERQRVIMASNNWRRS
ncbi:RNA-binding domain-containing protein [Trichocladium antarcticum]|uniref:RNA-binding domain-containing protein n=1 Tax=Trichocladium antarcticum TaxID=1450529 RepID=A0AAN6UFR2_9PEZI|nr:RNA-binding domain-containing protein [Trichocladium antarcticum]